MTTRNPRNPLTGQPQTTDAAGDELLPPYSLKDEYPAYKSGSFDKRQRTLSMRERGSFDHTLGDVVTDSNRARVAPTAMAQIAETDGGVLRRGPDPTDKQTVNRAREILDSWSLDPDLEEIANLKVFDRLPLEEIGQRVGMTKQAVSRRLDALRDYLFDHLENDESCGFDSILNREARKTIKARLDNSGTVYHAPSCSCGYSKFTQVVVPGQGVKYVCDLCKKSMSESDYTKMVSATRRGMLA